MEVDPQRVKRNVKSCSPKVKVLGDGRFAVFILSPLDFSFPVTRDYRE